MICGANTPVVLCVTSVCFSGVLVFRVSLVENGATYSRSDNGIRRTPQKEFLRAQQPSLGSVPLSPGFLVVVVVVEVENTPGNILIIFPLGLVLFF